MLSRAGHRWAAAVAAAILLAAGPVAAQSQPAPFPDVPPWHWAYGALTRDAQAGIVVGYPAGPAELIANSIAQVYDGFAHAQSPATQAWVERFTYDRPAAWPAPLTRSRLAGFAIRDVRTVVTGETATATFTARRTTRTFGGAAATAAGPMRVGLRFVDGDWKIDYATLASGDALFR